MQVESAALDPFKEHELTPAQISRRRLGMGFSLAFVVVAAFVAVRAFAGPTTTAANGDSPLDELLARPTEQPSASSKLQNVGETAAATQRDVQPSPAPDPSPAQLVPAASPLLEPAPHPAATLANPPDEKLADTINDDANDAVFAAENVEFATGGKFFVQAASFRVRATAEQLAHELQELGLPAVSAAYGGAQAGWWHVVRLGPFSTRIAAEEARLAMPVSRRNRAYTLPRSNGIFHVQVASFDSPEPAQRIATSLERRGHRSKVSEAKISGRTWHCVRIGPFDTREEAGAYEHLLERKGEHQAVVIPFE